MYSENGHGQLERSRSSWLGGVIRDHWETPLHVGMLFFAVWVVMAAGAVFIWALIAWVVIAVSF